jgi:hypothetical protein
LPDFLQRRRISFPLSCVRIGDIIVDRPFPDFRGAFMKFFRLFSFFLVFLITAPLTAQDFDAPPDEMQQVRNIEMRRHALLSKRAQFVSAAAENYDVTYYRLAVNFPSDATLDFSGSVRMELKSLINDLDVIELNLGEFGKIDSVLVGDVRLDAGAVSHTGDVLALTLPSSLQMDEALAVTMFYRHPYGGSAVTVKSVQNVDLGKQVLSIASQAEPYDARNWWPCKDDPADKADSIDVILTVEDPLYPVSNGLVVSDVSNGDGTRTVHWKSRYPIVTYLVSVAAAEYNFRELSFSHSGKTMFVGSWWYGTASNAMAVYEQDMLDALQILSDRLIPYPYLEEKYGMAEYEWGGAMEHQTVSSMGFYNTDVVVHELMHQWFGDKVTCATFEHIWLNEGWATYGEALFWEARGGLDALKANMATTAYYGPGTIFVNDPENNQGAIFSGSLSYNKASWVVHMLRHVVGDEAFFAATRKYLGGEDRDTYRSVTTAEYQQYYEDESGMDLDYFFQQWIYGEYYPTYSYDWSATADAGSYDVVLDLEQLYLPTRQLFTMPIDVYFRFADGSDTTIVVMNDAGSQQFTFRFDREPELLQLDPDEWILKRVIEKISNPSFDQGILVVNGVDWDVEAYTADLKTAFADSVFTGGLPYTLWDIFPNPNAGYPSAVPAPIGSGYVPGRVLGQYCTVVWLGNAYNGDENIWANTSIMEYLRAGGNVLLVTRMGRNFITEDMRALLGLNWSGNYVSAEDCHAKLPSLLNMDFTDDQNLVNVFSTTLNRLGNELLFTETQSFTEERGIGVWGKPMTTENGESGHMMYIGLRPYRIDQTQLKQNMASLLALMPCIPLTSVDQPGASAEGITLQQNYPNPVTAGSGTLIRYTLPQDLKAPLSLRVYDVLGRMVRDLSLTTQGAGVHSLTLQTSGLPAGVYTYALEGETISVSRKLVVME